MPPRAAWFCNTSPMRSSSCVAFRTSRLVGTLARCRCHRWAPVPARTLRAGSWFVLRLNREKLTGNHAGLFRCGSYALAVEASPCLTARAGVLRCYWGTETRSHECAPRSVRSKRSARARKVGRDVLSSFSCAKRGGFALALLLNGVNALIQKFSCSRKCHVVESGQAHFTGFASNHPEARVDRASLPRMGEMLNDQTGTQSPPETREEMLASYASHP